MRNLFKVVASEVIATLTVDDLKDIMNDTVATVLERMDPQERMAFSLDIVSRSFEQMLDGLDQEERKQLLQQLLPNILGELPLHDLDWQDLLATLTGRE